SEGQPQQERQDQEWKGPADGHCHIVDLKEHVYPGDAQDEYAYLNTLFKVKGDSLSTNQCQHKGSKEQYSNYAANPPRQEQLEQLGLLCQPEQQQAETTGTGANRCHNQRHEEKPESVSGISEGIRIPDPTPDK